jgi:hypothetical protein
LTNCYSSVHRRFIAVLYLDGWSTYEQQTFAGKLEEGSP